MIAVAPLSLLAGTISPGRIPATATAEAAKLSGLTEASIEWHETGAKDILIVARDPTKLPSLVENGPLKSCFFPWAYEHDVTVTFSKIQSVEAQ